MMERSEALKSMIKILIYVCFSVGGLILLKMGAVNNFEMSVSKGVFELKINSYLLIGMFFYIMSFITSLIVMRNMELSIFYPISAGLGYVCVCVASYYILKEAISFRQIVGMVLILVGIVIMNIKK